MSPRFKVSLLIAALAATVLQPGTSIAAAHASARARPYVASVTDVATTSKSVIKIQFPAKLARKTFFVSAHKVTWWNCKTDRSALVRGGCKDVGGRVEWPGDDGTVVFKADAHGLLRIVIPFDVCLRPSSRTRPHGVNIFQVDVKVPPGYDTLPVGAYAANAAKVAAKDAPYWDFQQSRKVSSGRTACS
ncbi:MAG: hypothetical protein JWQ74_81 [Marmoricola sp.]|nr:hypothetical protein [Marmoricola sp.]